MIVAVEGPSAAGKTTWCRRHHRDHIVAEYQPTGHEPGDGDPGRQAAYWTAVSAGRWSAALRHERQAGIAVCDSDPLKVHYSWSLAAIGAGSPARFHAEAAAARAAITARRLGFTDLVLVTLPPVDVLRSRRDADPARRRHHFELHMRLVDPLKCWYTTLNSVTPGRVVWEFPATPVSRRLPAPRPDRYDVDLFDRFLDALPILGSPLAW